MPGRPRDRAAPGRVARRLKHELVEAADRLRLAREDLPSVYPTDFDGAWELAERLFTTPALRAARAGAPAGPSQRRAELRGLVELLRPRRPRVAVEIGTERGGTHFVIGHALPSLELTVAVDLRVRNRGRLRRLHRPELEVRVVEDDSHAPTTLARVRELLGGRDADLVLIDGDHSFAGVTEDLRMYAPLLGDGGLIALHDIVPDDRMRYGTPTRAHAGEVPIAWEQLKVAAPSRVIAELVDSWEQDGSGLGVLRWDPALEWPFSSAARG